MNSIILLLQNIFLQQDWDIRLRNLFRTDPSATLEPSQTGSIVETAIALMIIVVIGIGVYLFWKVKNAKRQYAGDGEPLGYYEIMIQKGDFLKGNLSRYEIPFLPKTREMVEQIPYMKKVSDHLEKLVQEEHLFAYEMRTTNDTISDIKGKSRDVLIVSSEDLTDSRIQFQSKKFTRLTGERAKIVFSYVTSRKHDVVTPDNNIQDVYVISPIPMYDKGIKKEFGFVEAAFLQQKHTITVNQLMQTKALGQAVMMMEAVTLAEQHLDLKDMRIEELKDTNDDWQEDIMTHRRTEDVYQGRVNEQPLMGQQHPVTISERGEPWGWFILFAVAPIAAFLIVPEFLNTIPGWFGAILGLGFMIALRFIITRRQSAEDEREARRAAGGI